MKTGSLTLEELVEAFGALGGEADWGDIRNQIAVARQHSIKPYKTKVSYEGSLLQLLYQRCDGFRKYKGDAKFEKVGDSRYRLLDFDVQSRVSREAKPPELGNLEDVVRRSRERNEFKRNPKLVVRIKTMYGSQCQLCGTTLLLPSGEIYAEAHHVCGLGDRGPDDLSNMLCVCPNCHALLDLKAIQIERATLKVIAGHALGQKFLDHHNALFQKNWSANS
jgi:hypothetical protein